jgi:hypothetical protein
MNPDLFSNELILSPSTAHRISRLTRLKRSGRPLFTDWLLARKINAFAFFMDEDLLQTIGANGFKNDSNRALHDLQSQLPKPIRDELWPQKRCLRPPNLLLPIPSNKRMMTRRIAPPRSLGFPWHCPPPGLTLNPSEYLNSMTA